MKSVRVGVNAPVGVQEKFAELTTHVAWFGEVSGIEAEALLRLQRPNTFLLRQGEKEDQFYLSYTNGTDLLHLPFTIDYASMQWFYRNGFPHFAEKLEVFIPEIMHREKDACYPLERIQMKS